MPERRKREGKEGVVCVCVCGGGGVGKERERERERERENFTVFQGSHKRFQWQIFHMSLCHVHSC